MTNSSASLITSPLFYETDQSNNPLAGGKVYSYQAGTLTPLTTYTDATLTVPNPNPVILDAYGKAQIWLGPYTYKLNVTDVNNVQHPDYPVDNLQSIQTTASNIATAAVLAQLASTASGQGAALVGYKGTATGEVAQTVNQKLIQRKSIWDFMTPAQIADTQLLNPLLDLSAPLAAASAWLALNFSTSHINELPSLALIFPAGIYQYSVSPNWAFNDVNIINEGKVIFRYTGTGDAVIIDSVANGGHGVFGMNFGRFIVEAPSTAGCGLRCSLVSHSKISVMVKGCGNAATGTNLNTTGGQASFSTNQMTLQTIPTGGQLPGYLPVGSIINAVSVAAGTYVTGIVSGAANTVGTVYSLSTSPGTLATRAYTSSVAVGIVVLGCVCTEFDTPSVSINDGFYGWYSTPIPNIGMFFGAVAPVGHSSCNIVKNPAMEGLSGIGIWIQAADANRFIGGTCEATTGIGLEVEYGCALNTVDGTDFENNSNFDILVNGDSGVYKNVSATGGTGSGIIVFQNGATANQFMGGKCNKFVFQAGSTLNVLDNMRVNAAQAASWLTDQTGGGGGQNYIGKVIDVYQGSVGIPYVKLSFGTPNTITNNARNPLLIYLNTSITGMTIYDPSGSGYTVPVSAQVLLQPGAKVGLSGTTTVYGHYI